MRREEEMSYIVSWKESKYMLCMANCGAKNQDIISTLNMRRSIIFLVDVMFQNEHIYHTIYYMRQ